MTSRPVLVIVAAALLIRVGLVFATDYRPAFDAADYDRIAQSIAFDGGYPDTTFGTPGTPSAYRPPGYPYVLGAVYWVAGHDLTAARLVGAVLGTGTVLLIIVLGSWLRDRPTGLVAGAIAAAYPPLIDIGATLLSEGLFIGLMLAAMAASMAYRRSQGALRWALAAGALCGLAALTRANGTLLLVPAAIAILGATAVPRRARLSGFALLLLGLAVVFTPWAVRNLDAYDSFVPISTQTGFVAAVTYNADAKPGTWDFNYAIPRDLARHFEQDDEAGIDSAGRRYARRYVVDHPDVIPRLMGVMTLRSLGIRRPADLAARQDEELGLSPRRANLTEVSFWLLVGIAVLAAASAALRGRLSRVGPWWFWLAPVLIALSTLPFAGSPRYRSVLEPFLVLLAASALMDAALRSRLARWSWG